MGVCASSSQKSTVEEDAAQTKDQASPLNAHETKQKPPSKIQSRVREQAAKEPSRQNVAVDFEQRNSGASLERKWSRLSSQKSQPIAGEGQLGPTGVYVPSSSFRTPQLKAQMAEQYDMPEEEVEKAMDFAESEEYVDIYCFTYCITGGPMEPTAFKVAGLQGMDKEAILQWATAPGNEDLRALNPLEQRRHKKAKEEFLIQQALQPEFEDSEAQPEDIEDLAEAYRLRFEADTHDMGLQEVLTYFGVPEVSRVAIHKHLYPSKGSSNASQDELARRKAAHPIALAKFDELATQ